MPQGQQYASNVPQTTLVSGGVNASSLTCTVAASAGWPAPPFSAVFELGTSSQEIVQVTGVTGVTWSITRGVDGTTPAAHGAGATVTHTAIGRDYREPRAHLDATTSPDSTGYAVHGLATGSAVVGTTDVQTLTNKTLTSPTISSPAVSGGTFTGTTFSTPTFSGMATFSGGATVPNGQFLTLASNTTQPIIGPTCQGYAGAFSGSGFSLGNGTMYGTYIKIGKLVYFEAWLQRGSTTTYGPTLVLNLPVAPVNRFVCTGRLVTSFNYDIPLQVTTATAAGGVNYFRTGSVSGSVDLSNALTDTVPQAGSSGDLVVFHDFYLGV